MRARMRSLREAIGLRLDGAARRMASTREGVLVAFLLASFAALWTLYAVLAHAAVDLHEDFGEAMGWSREFAFGYKHPPLTAWAVRLWFAAFPAADWAGYLLATLTPTATLAIVWRLLRDHLDRDRALYGLAALMLVPFFTFQAFKFNANTVMMPFWAACLLFYLRARRDGRVADAFLAGLAGGLALLGKYWAVHLVAGLAAASLVGPGVARFWRSALPWAMAAGGALAFGPHLVWLWAGRDGAADAFLSGSVLAPRGLLGALADGTSFLVGCAAYVVGPLALLALLKPDRAAARDVLRPADPMRRIAGVLLLVPLASAVLVNLALPTRLSAVWAFPNWALLPLALYGSPSLVVGPRAAARALSVAFALAALAVAAAPLVALAGHVGGRDAERQHFRALAAEAARLAPGATLVWSLANESLGMPFYLPGARALQVQIDTPAARAAVAREGVVIVCRAEDAFCRRAPQVFGSGFRQIETTSTRSFLGVPGRPMSYVVTAVPPAPAR
jgi:4-amino-4-deoxy-L-arabinose transferase-like glycosyltransferase